MGLHLSSAWSTPRGWRLITVTLIALTLLLVIPLHRLSDDSPGVYGHLTKYLSHEGAAYDVEEGFIANLNETTNEQIVKDEDPDRQTTVERISYDTDTPQYTGEEEKEAPNTPEMPEGAQQPEGEQKPSVQDDRIVLEVDHSIENEVAHNEKIHSEAPTEASKPEGIDIKPQGDQVGENKSQQGAGQSQSHGDQQKPQSQEDEPQVKNISPNGDDKRPDGIKIPDLSQNQNGQQDENGIGGTETKTPEVSTTTSIAGVFTPSQTAELDVPSGPLSNWTGVCDGFPNTDGIMLVMKTGATEAFTKLPAHLLTSLQCLDDYLLFSDLVSKQLLVLRGKDAGGTLCATYGTPYQATIPGVMQLTNPDRTSKLTSTKYTMSSKMSRRTSEKAGKSLIFTKRRMIVQSPSSIVPPI